MYTIRKAKHEEAAIIQRLGTEIYNTTYRSILSIEQIQFMLHKNYSPEAIQQSMLDGQDFYVLFQKQSKPLGFIALQRKDEFILRVEKLYLLKESQGQGLGRRFITFAVEKAKEQHYSVLELNVNRGNQAYYFYLKEGFQVVEEVDIPYHGYVLDDYVMQKLVG